MLMPKREMNKKIVLALILFIVFSGASLLLAEPVKAQTSPSTSGVPTPSVPEFTLSFSNPTLFGNATTPTITLGFIDVTIKNQPFPSVVNGNTTIFYYIVRVKPHSDEDDWVNQSQSDNSSSPYTLTQIDVSSYQGFEIDIQVQATLGYYYTYTVQNTWNGYPYGAPESITSFIDLSSGWSPTQTITIPANSILASPNSTVTPHDTTGNQTKTAANWIEVALFIAVAVIVALVVVVVAMTVRHRKTANSKLWMQIPKD
jgi:hypothetical protein